LYCIAALLCENKVYITYNYPQNNKLSYRQQILRKLRTQINKNIGHRNDLERSLTLKGHSS